MTSLPVRYSSQNSAEQILAARINLNRLLSKEPERPKDEKDFPSRNCGGYTRSGIVGTGTWTSLGAHTVYFHRYWWAARLRGACARMCATARGCRSASGRSSSAACSCSAAHRVAASACCHLPVASSGGDPVSLSLSSLLVGWLPRADRPRGSFHFGAQVSLREFS